MQVSWEVAECIALRKRNHSEYEGDICTTAPLIVEVVSWLETHGLLEYTNAMMALLLPLILYLIAKRSASSENLQHIAGTTINKDASSILLTAAYRNAALVTGSLTAIAILVMSVIFAEPFFWLRPLCMWSAIALSYDRWILSCLLCAVLIYDSIFCLPLAATLACVQSMYSRNGLYTYLLTISIAAFLIWISSYSPSGWTFLHNVYLSKLFHHNLTPNQGLFWYLFTQMFEHYKLFFVCIFFTVAMTVGILPIFVLRQPILLYIISASFVLMFMPSVPITEVVVAIASLSVTPATWALHRYRLLCCFGFAVCAVLGPVIWHAWLYVGTANPNFFYFISILFNLSWAVCLSELSRAEVFRHHLLNGKAK